jgi:autotransporter-associated beta strand protein/T5SS/PEP-CTERM-associated repeat protein
LIALAAARGALAAQTTWRGSAGASWSVASNWTSSLPSTTIDAYLDNGNLAVVNQPNQACQTLTLGSTTNRTGNLNVQSGTLSINSTLYDGQLGSGTVSAGGGSQVVLNGDAFLGYNSGAAGTLTVSGSNTSFTVTDPPPFTSRGLYVGTSGSGAMAITQGASVNSFASCHVGYDDGAFGTLTIAGSNSILNLSSTNANNNSLSLGTGTISVTSGGSLSAGLVGYSGGSAAVGAIIVDGSGSAFSCAYGIGIAGSGTESLTIRNGGKVLSPSGNASVSYDPGSKGTVVIDGAGSVLSASNAYLGYGGPGMMSVTNGGRLQSAFGAVGYSHSSTFNMLVDGPGSNWTNAGEIDVGVSGGTNSVTVSNGGEIDSAQVLTLGYDRGALSTLLVDGPGSKVAVSNTLNVGNYGYGVLTIRNSGHVSSGRGTTGNFGGPALVTVDGNNSQWLVTGFMTINSGAVNVSNGGLMTCSDFTLTNSSGTGSTAASVTIAGAGSALNMTGSATIQAGVLSITNGALATCTSGYLGASNRSYGTVVVTGSNSAWQMSGDLTLNYGTLNIGAGGQVSNANAYVSHSSSASVSVSGSGSSWNLGGLYVGDLFTSGSVSVDSGAKMASTTACIGYSSHTNGSVTLSGSGSTWTASSVFVGGSGTAIATAGTGSINISNGGQLSISGKLKLWSTDSSVTVASGQLSALVLDGTSGSIRITDAPGLPALSIGSSLSSTFGGRIADFSGPGSLYKLGMGTQTLSGSNSYSGTTNVFAGALVAGSSSALSRNSVFALGGSGQSGVLDLAGFSNTIAGLTTASVDVGQVVTTSRSGTATLTINNDASTSNTDCVFGGTLQDGGSANVLGLTKKGGRTLTLSGSNTYTGPTTINQGELVVNGSLVSRLTINSGGVLGGTGSLSSVTVSASGHIAPGNSPGVLNLSGSLSLLSGALMDYELDTPLTSDEVYMPTSLLSLNGQQISDFNFTALGGFMPGTYTLIDAGSISGSLGAITDGAINGLPASLAIQGNDLVLTVVPEPGTLGLLCGLGVGVAAFARRRRKRRTTR